MSSRKFKLTEKGDKVLEISHKTFSSDYTIKYKGRELATVEGETLRRLRKVFRSNNRSLGIQLFGSSVFGERWDIRINDQPAWDSDMHPRRRLEGASDAIFVAVGFSIIALAISTLLGISLLGETDNTSLMVQLFLIFVQVGLGFSVRQRSKLSLQIAIGVYLVDTLMLIWSILIGLLAPTLLGSLVIRAFILRAMWRGFGALHELRATQKDANTRGLRPEHYALIGFAAIVLVIAGAVFAVRGGLQFGQTDRLLTPTYAALPTLTPIALVAADEQPELAFVSDDTIHLIGPDAQIIELTDADKETVSGDFPAWSPGWPPDCVCQT